MRLIDVHRSVQFSQAVGRAQRTLVAAMDAKRDKLAAKPNATASRPLGHAMQLGFASGACAVMGRVIDRDKLLFGSVALCMGAAGLTRDSDRLAEMFPVSSRVLAAPLGIVLSLGLGRLPNAFATKQHPLLILSQHGLLGLPRYFLEEKYLKSLDAGNIGTARACLVGATLLSVPQEFVRALVFIAVTILAVAVAVAMGIAGSAINAKRCFAQSSSCAPRHYMAFADTRRDVILTTSGELEKIKDRYTRRSTINVRLSVLNLYAEAFAEIKASAKDGLLKFDQAMRALPPATASTMVVGAIDDLDRLTQRLQHLRQGVCFQDDARRFAPLFEARAVMRQLDLNASEEDRQNAGVWATQVETLREAEHQIFLADALARVPAAHRAQARQFEHLLRRLFTFKCYVNDSFGSSLDRLHVSRPALSAA